MDRFVYTRENLRKLQLTELEMLKELDRICRENKIRYIIDAGTLLGAVRHGGFIPWDDDIDVRMLRRDYARFCEACKTELGEKYFLQTYRTDPGYRWGYARILKKGTVYKRKGQHRMTAKNGIFIDIFPNDNLPDTLFANKLCTGLSWICRKILYSEVGIYNKNRFSSWLGFHILNLLPKEWGHRGMEYLSRKYRNIKTARVRCFGWGDKVETAGFLRKWNEETRDILFEGITVSAPEDLEGFLTCSFGKDYMTLPPEEKRKPAHIADYIHFGE